LTMPEENGKLINVFIDNEFNDVLIETVEAPYAGFCPLVP